MILLHPNSTLSYPLFPYPTLFRSLGQDAHRYLASLSISRSAVEQPFQNQPFIEWGCFEVAVESKSSPESSPGKMAAQRLLEALDRSEEHTSELLSLMRISYAVFCLKKKRTPVHNRQIILTSN